MTVVGQNIDARVKGTQQQVTVTEQNNIVVVSSQPIPFALVPIQSQDLQSTLPHTHDTKLLPALTRDTQGYRESHVQALDDEEERKEKQMVLTHLKSRQMKVRPQA